MELLSLTGLRQDGRRPNELRRVQLQLGVLPLADGSCTLEQGLTKIVASVRGPRETPASGRGCVQCQVSFAPFAASERKKPRSGGGRERRANELALALEDALAPLVQTNLFPHSRVELQVHVVQTDGSVVATAFNACVLALIDAGVPMYDFAVACAVGHAQQAAAQLLDPNQSEAANASEVWVCVLPRSQHVLSLGVRGKVAADALPGLVALAQQGCSQLFGVLESLVVRGIVN